MFNPLISAQTIKLKNLIKLNLCENIKKFNLFNLFVFQIFTSTLYQSLLDAQNKQRLAHWQTVQSSFFR